MKLLLFFLMMFSVFSAHAQADLSDKNSSSAPTKIGELSVTDVLESLQGTLYHLGETTGSVEEMDRQEKLAAIKIVDIAKQNPSVLLSPDKEGNTPLMRAVWFGYRHVVAGMLTFPEVRSNLNTKIPPNKETDITWTIGLMAQIMPEETRLMCNPGILESPFIFVPALLKMPYLQQSGAYKTIATSLVAAGALGPSPSELAKAWKKKCPATPYFKNASKLTMDVLAKENSEFLIKAIEELRKKSEEKSNTKKPDDLVSGEMPEAEKTIDKKK